MMKWRVNKRKLRNLTLNLNEKLYWPIFAKRIHPKFAQYSLQRWLNMWKKLSELFRYKRIPQYYCLIQYFSVKEPDETLGKSSSFSASYQLLLVLLNGHLVFCENRKQTLEVLWGRIVSNIWHYCALNVLMSTE